VTFGKRQPRGHQGVERRRHTREKVNFTAHVVLSSGQLVRCHLTDYSTGGARISITPALALPDTFELRGIGRICHVRLVHRSVGGAGVKFI